MKVNFKEVKLFDIDNVPIPIEKSNIHKAIANILYLQAKNLDLVDIAIKINRGETIDVSKLELEGIKETILNSQIGLSAFVKKATIEYINSIGREDE